MCNFHKEGKTKYMKKNETIIIRSLEIMLIGTIWLECGAIGRVKEDENTIQESLHIGSEKKNIEIKIHY